MPKNDLAPTAPLPALRPFLKWAGGKRQLLPVLCSCVPPYQRYIEPFLGAGALFFALGPQQALLSDLNPELMNCFEVVKNDVEALIRELQNHEHNETYYYFLRDADRAEDFRSWPALARASRFIYLNRTCFNGLYRVNARGHFNVPFGRYANPQIVNAPLLRACSAALQKAVLRCSPFTWIADTARPGDFVYFDPPYVPLNMTSSFTSYTSEGFDESMQSELVSLCRLLDKRGVLFLLSNSGSPSTTALYNGFAVATLPARRSIAARNSSRKTVSEVLVANFPLPGLVLDARSSSERQANC